MTLTPFSARKSAGQTEVGPSKIKGVDDGWSKKARAQFSVCARADQCAGSGLARHAGGTPANFLDVGGGASPERIATALKLVLSDPKVSAVLVNIFAGINRCDWVAKGVVQACNTVDVQVPLVVRLAGTNVEEGRKILAESGLELITAETLAEAAEKAVAAYRSVAGKAA